VSIMVLSLSYLHGVLAQPEKSLSDNKDWQDASLSYVQALDKCASTLSQAQGLPDSQAKILLKQQGAAFANELPKWWQGYVLWSQCFSPQQWKSEYERLQPHVITALLPWTSIVNDTIGKKLCVTCPAECDGCGHSASSDARCDLIVANVGFRYNGKVRILFDKYLAMDKKFSDAYRLLVLSNPYQANSSRCKRWNHAKASVLDSVARNENFSRPQQAVDCEQAMNDLGRLLGRAYKLPDAQAKALLNQQCKSINNRFWKAMPGYQSWVRTLTVSGVSQEKKHFYEATSVLAPDLVAKSTRYLKMEDNLEEMLQFYQTWVHAEADGFIGRLPGEGLVDMGYRP
jgi:hypothetical protein